MRPFFSTARVFVISLQFQKLWNDSWFLLELKSTKTIHNCEQSLLLLEGKRQGICASQKHMGGEFQFGNGTAVFLPLELNLNRLISKEIAVFCSLSGEVTNKMYILSDFLRHKISTY